MNYIIEGPKSFASLLNDDTTDNEEIADDVRCCLISGEPLGINHITLRCGHLFNYKPLYNELIQASAESNLPVYSIKCPYCREYTQPTTLYSIYTRGRKNQICKCTGSIQHDTLQMSAHI